MLGFVLVGDPSLQHRILGSALAQFPVMGPQIQRNVHSLQGSGLAIGTGLVVGGDGRRARGRVVLPSAVPSLTPTLPRGREL